MKEHFEHDDCPKCGAVSEPREGVPDQALRGCSGRLCNHVWREDLTKPPLKTWNPDNDRGLIDDRILRTAGPSAG